MGLVAVAVEGEWELWVLLAWGGSWGGSWGGNVAMTSSVMRVGLSGEV